MIDDRLAVKIKTQVKIKTLEYSIEWHIKKIEN